MAPLLQFAAIRIRTASFTSVTLGVGVTVHTWRFRGRFLRRWVVRWALWECLDRHSRRQRVVVFWGRSFRFERRRYVAAVRRIDSENGGRVFRRQRRIDRRMRSIRQQKIPLHDMSRHANNQTKVTRKRKRSSHEGTYLSVPIVCCRYRHILNFVFGSVEIE